MAHIPILKRRFGEVMDSLRVESQDRVRWANLLTSAGSNLRKLQPIDFARAAVTHQIIGVGGDAGVVLRAFGWGRNMGRNPWFFTMSKWERWRSATGLNTAEADAQAEARVLLQHHKITAPALPPGKLVQIRANQRKGGGASGTGGGQRPGGNQWSKWLGFHGDENTAITTPLLVTKPVQLSQVTPQNTNGAMALWRHLDSSDYESQRAQREAAAALGFEEPTIIFVPFTAQNPGTNDSAQNDAALAVFDTQVALYQSENIIVGFGNLNADNFMTGSSAAVRNANWWALEARAIALVEARGLRWCATDDQGIVSMCQTIVARRAAWALEGIDPDDCEFICFHGYTASGFVPSHLLLAEASFARVGVTTEIRMTECAYDFLRLGETIDDDRPWLFQDNPIGDAHPQALTWTRLLCRWFRFARRHMLIFDWPMLHLSGAASPWGEIFIADQRDQIPFAFPTPGSVWNHPDAETRAAALALSNGGTLDDAQVAADWIAAGNLFNLDPAPVVTNQRITGGGDTRITGGGDTRVWTS